MSKEKGVNNKVRKPVSFNRTKEHDRAMLKFLGRRNFSGYVKKLIQEDMKERKIKKEGVSGGNKKGEHVPYKEEVFSDNSKDKPTEVKSEKRVEVTDTVETSGERISRLRKELNHSEVYRPTGNSGLKG